MYSEVVFYALNHFHHDYFNLFIQTLIKLVEKCSYRYFCVHCNLKVIISTFITYQLLFALQFICI